MYVYQKNVHQMFFFFAHPSLFQLFKIPFLWGDIFYAGKVFFPDFRTVRNFFRSLKHRNLSTRTSMFALVKQTFLAKNPL
jgi:hypothetical protein